MSRDVSVTRRWKSAPALWLSVGWLCTLQPGPAGTLWAQTPRIDILLPTKEALAKEAPTVRTVGIVTSPHTAELIRNGFPARLHYKLERWAAGTFVNDVKATKEWEVIVEYDALENQYRVMRVTDEKAVVLGTFDKLRDAETKVAEPYRVSITLPKQGEKGYYALKLQVEAMSLGDLDEVRRWLKGELRPVVRGRRSPGTALTIGVRTLLVHLLGGERGEYHVSTGVFRP